MKTIPVKFEAEGKWISAKIGIDETTIHLPEPINTQIPIKSIDNVQQRKNLLTISVAEKDYRIATVPKALAILKRVILMGVFRLSPHGIFYVSCHQGAGG